VYVAVYIFIDFKIEVIEIRNKDGWNKVEKWILQLCNPTKSTLYFWPASPKVSPSSVCLSFTGANIKGGVYSRIHSGLYEDDNRKQSFK